jgi:hypothetical protein
MTASFSPEDGAIGNIIDTAVTQRIASEEPPRGENRSLYRPEFAHSLGCVARAGRLVLAASRKGGGNPALVEAEQ